MTIHIAAFNHYFKNDHLKKYLAIDNTDEKYILPNDIFENFKKVPKLNKTRCLQLFLTAVTSEQNRAHGLTRFFITKLHSYALHKETECFHRCLIEKRLQLPDLTKEWCTLKEMSKKAAILRKDNNYLARPVLCAINSEVHKLTKDGKFNPPYFALENFKAANTLYTASKSPILILAAIPTTHEHAQQYVHDVLKQKGTLFISAHEEIDCIKNREKHIEFCKEYIPKIMHDLFSATLQSTSEEVIESAATFLVAANVAPQLVETTWRFDNGKTIKQIHYRNWVDGTVCPNLRLLETLLDRMAELNPDPNCPIAVNCFGGIGRSAVIAICFYLRQKLFNALKNGEDLDTIVLNIPQKILYLRQFRENIIYDAAHLPTIYSIVALYYQRFLEEKRKQTTMVIPSVKASADVDPLTKKFAQVTISK